MSTKLIIQDHFDFNLEEDTFILNDEQYEYLLAYGPGGLNERMIEIPLMCKYLQEPKGKDILEIGAVISLLIKTNFDVVDLTEKEVGVINIDILNYYPDKKYDLIISISTIEHFGYGDYDEIEDPTKLEKALDHILQLLKPSGIFVASAPIGFNENFDSMIINKQLPFQQIYFMKRYTSGIWKQTEFEEAIKCKYNLPFNYGNSIALMIYKNE